MALRESSRAMSSGISNQMFLKLTMKEPFFPVTNEMLRKLTIRKRLWSLQVFPYNSTFTFQYVFYLSNTEFVMRISEGSEMIQRVKTTSYLKQK